MVIAKGWQLTLQLLAAAEAHWACVSRAAEGEVKNATDPFLKHI